MAILLLFAYSTSSHCAELKVGIYNNPPKIFLDESEKPAGIFPDILEYIAKNEGWNLKYIECSWEVCLEKLLKNEIDIMPDVASTPERENIYKFHKVPVLSSWSQVYVAKSENINSIFDLAGKRIAVLKGSSQEKAIKRLFKGLYLDTEIVSLTNFDAIFKAVADGGADAAVVNRFYGLLNYKTFGLKDTGVVLEPASLFFAANIALSQIYLDKIDNHLVNMKENPKSVYYTSFKKWTSEKFEVKIPDWVYTWGYVLLAILFMSLSGSFILKRQVEVCTKQLRKLNREMEQKIIDRTKELSIAMEQAQEADRIKSAFLATMSHELRTPLNSIIGFTGILLQGLAGQLNDEQQKQMSMVQNSARHLLSLINDVLDISKIESGQLTISMEEFDVEQSIKKVIEIITPLAEKKGLKLLAEIKEPEIMIGDERRFEQIVLNLLTNAIKFTEKGEISLKCIDKENILKVDITDTGIGIDEEHLKKLFTPFYQVDSGLTRKSEGTGLGLSISKKLANMMGGEILAKSKPGEGSTFSLIINKKGNGYVEA